MSNYKFGVVILHYKTEKETIHCARSILKLKDSEKAIILIVDNASKDGSLNRIKEELNKFNNVIYQQNNENIGFSKAHNRAYRLLKEEYGIEFLVLLNNDTIIKQKDFLKKIILIFNREPYAVLGPDTYVPTLKCHQNPLYKEIPNIEILKQDRLEWKEKLNDISITECEYLKGIRKDKIKSKIPFFMIAIRKRLKNEKEFFNFKHRIENPVLTGACIILTPVYIEKFDEVFSPETKFYFEELILAQKCKALNLKTLYTPELKIVHYHAVSTRKSLANLKQYIIFTHEQLLESFEIYKDYFLSLQSGNKS